ncbi:MAG: hypothetical protein HRU35_06050 [Rickettsiaceae bacterium]|nr:hypothetical protein [Rickettsiaceae bacterium]
MQQTTFPIEAKKIAAYNHEEYIVSSSNNTSYNRIMNWPQNWGVKPYEKSLLLTGSKSSGKTYLATIWAKLAIAKFITKETELTTATINNNQAFILEDIDKDIDEQQILHYFNILHENQKYLLITSCRNLQIKLPDLSSRLNSINKLSINMPDDELVKMLIFKLFSNYSIVVSPEIINYLLMVIPREFDKIIEYIECINKYALENKRKVTIPLVKEALSLLV